MTEPQAKRLTPNDWEEWEKLRQKRPSDSSTSRSNARGNDNSPAHVPNQEPRTPYQKDLDRLLYNYYTRRLARVTQVTTVASRSGGDNGDAYRLTHNRLTHSLKVGQVARRTAQYLHVGLSAENNKSGIRAAGGVDFDVAEFAGRAHDIGHPPFGHAGEQALDGLARKWGLPDGFEGNAQTFRILTQLTLKGLKTDISTREALESDFPRGLDLTYASLASVVKYPWGFGQQPCSNPNDKPDPARTSKFGFYDVDRISFDNYVRPLLYLDGLGTLEAQIMDWADDVSYAVHDVEDFAFQGKIPIHTVSSESASQFLTEVRNQLEEQKEKQRAAFDTDSIIKKFTGYIDAFFSVPLGQSEFDYCRMSQFISTVITEASLGTSVSHDGKLTVTPHARGLITIVKHLTKYYVIDQPGMHAQQEGDKRILSAVTSELKRIASKAYNERPTRMSCVLPQPLCESVENAIKQYRETTASSLQHKQDQERIELGIKRGVIDYVASLTEDDVFNLYRLYGLSAQ